VGSSLSLTTVSPLPDQVSDAEGACLGIPCMTAHCALFGDGPLQDTTVLVTSGAGAVGHYAIQLAKWGGARVLTTVSSPEKAAHALRGGADVVVDYRQPAALQQLREAAGPRGVQRIVDVDAAANLPFVQEIAADAAQWVTYAIGPQPAAAFPLAAQNIKQEWLGMAKDNAELVPGWQMPVTD
jgi:NADPH:quinone reductase